MPTYGPLEQRWGDISPWIHPGRRRGCSVSQWHWFDTLLEPMMWAYATGVKATGVKLWVCIQHSPSYSHRKRFSLKPLSLTTRPQSYSHRSRQYTWNRITPIGTKTIKRMDWASNQLLSHAHSIQAPMDALSKVRMIIKNRSSQRVCRTLWFPAHQINK